MPRQEIVRQALMASMGLSFLRLHTLGLALRAGEIELVHVEDTPVIRTWNVVHLPSRVLSPAADAFRFGMIDASECDMAEHDRPWRQPVAEG